MDDLTELANARMPFGKYKDRFLIDLPDTYLVWFSRQGFPEGKLGRMLASVLEIKVNGLEKLVRPLRRQEKGRKDQLHTDSHTS
jgi:uncharacterized protein (DUF3820 family)